MHAAHSDIGSGQQGPALKSVVPGPETHTWWLRAQRVTAPMGPRLSAGTRRSMVVLARGAGCNVWDVDDNRFVDLAAGFGSLLLGHNHAYVRRAVELQSARLFQAMGDLYPADAKIGLSEQLVRLLPGERGQVILGQSGADAVTAALKTAQLHTGRSRVVSFHGSYHGLSYAPLAASGLRDSYRVPFAAQLNPHVSFVDFPSEETEDAALIELERVLSGKEVGALLLEPIQGRGGVRSLSASALLRLREMTARTGTLLIADEIWTGLGRAGSWLRCTELGVEPDLVCLGKGLGGGLPISACLGSPEVMSAWFQEEEVVHTATFAGAPLACATALATLDVLRRHRLLERAAKLGQVFKASLQASLREFDVAVRGEGLMVAVDFGARPQIAAQAMGLLLERGYLTSTGGGARETLVLTPPLIIEPALLDGFVPQLVEVCRELSG